MKRSPLFLLLLLLSLAACGDSQGPTTTTTTAPTDPTNPAGPPLNEDDPVVTTPPSSAPITTADGSAAAAPNDGGSSSPQWPGAQAFFFSFPVQRQASNPAWGTALTDILRHMHPSFYSTLYDFPDDRIRWGVEITHGISAHLRFAYNVTGKPANGFYVMQDRATLVVEPTAMKLADVTPRVPMSLRGPHFAQELGEQATTGSANDKPTFLLEDWIAATNGSEVGIDLVKQNLWGTTTAVRDGVGTTFELTVYALAWAQAAMAVDPSYFQSNPLTRELLAWNTERALRLYDEGSQFAAFKNNAQETYQANFKTSPDAVTLRNFARRLFSGAYVSKVLGIPAAKE